MTRLVGLALGACVAVGCGTAVTTGSARNDYATPTGRATATNARYVNPDEPARTPRRNPQYANDYAEARRASDVSVAPAPGAVPPPAEAVPPPDVPPPDTTPHGPADLPPYSAPDRP